MPGARKNVALIGDGQDRARDEVPFLVQLDRNDRLDVQREPVAVARATDVVVVVTLQRYADQARDGIRQFFRELLGRLITSLCGSDQRKEQQEQPQRRSGRDVRTSQHELCWSSVVV